MKVVKFRLLILSLLAAICSTISAQTVRDIEVQQVEKQIHITYTLDNPADISVYFSADGGKNYQKLYKVTGDVGKNISPGRKTVVWDVLAECEQLKGDNFLFKVRTESVTVSDIDGNEYKTVKIGNQMWMAENLRTTRYADGTTIPMGSSARYRTPYRYYPNDKRDNVLTYGYLYNWTAVMHGASSSKANHNSVQGICPTGWHVPSDAEWKQLINYVKNQDEYNCNGRKRNIAKTLSSTEGWKTGGSHCAVGNNTSSNNATDAFPAGMYDDHYRHFSNSAYFWSATQKGNNYAYYHRLNYRRAFVYRKYGSKDYGCSVRCVRDDEGVPEKKREKPEKKQEKPEKKREKPVSYSTFFTLNAAYSLFPQWSYGFKVGQVGQVKVVGWYFSAMTSIELQGLTPPYVRNGKQYVLNGNEKAVRYSLQAGLVVRTCEPLYLLLGAGYGYRTFSVQTIGGNWFRFPTNTHIGIDFSLGLMFKIKPGLLLSMEAVTTKFKTLEAKVGIGFSISNRKRTSKN